MHFIDDILRHTERKVSNCTRVMGKVGCIHHKKLLFG